MLAVPPIEEAERICASYKDAPPVRFASGRAFYRPSDDIVSVPPLCDYPKPEEYYSTLFHEHVHSTGHSKRLNRSGITEIAAFGDENYSKEGIDNSTMQNSVAYIGGWLRKLKEDKKLIVQAAAQAQKAADYILGVTFEEDAT